MKSVTEFANPVLQKILTAKKSLAAEGKSPEEISQAIGESMKLEGDKLKYALSAADLAADKAAVRRVVVYSAAEGETAPPRFQRVEETYYLVETVEPVRAAAPAPTKGGKFGGRGGGKGGDRPKSSPWGQSPEELAAKKAASSQAKKQS